jgi:hypothetical protein
VSAALLVELNSAVAAQDARRVQEIASEALAKLSPSGLLAELAARADASRQLDELTAEFEADEKALAYLDQEGLLDRLEDGFALLVPTLADGAVPLEAWAIPLLSALAGPGAPFLSFGLTIACKIALAALKAWAAKRVTNIPKK